ncbi:hypothetical protein [Tunturibacter empetritectus]|uniref:Ig-like domain-containing protein n=1 Tax=Tunturiibacter empetritectus TaxID=3069691 RepID=A0A7W8IMA8_9BACT|nr:hypothetical protein [Edaphobacter lichenicola]MBB5319110.1 hypothetical protein [Edaphobacter lichenicola]
MHLRHVSPDRLSSHAVRLAGALLHSGTRLLVALCIAASPLPALAQAVKTASTPPPDFSRFDLYGGYAYFHPFNSEITPFVYQPINPGAVASATAYFNRYLGLQAEGSFFPNGPNDCYYTAQAGPVLRYQKGRLIPFVHALGGGARAGGPAFQPCTWGWGVTAGGGLDLVLPVFNNHIALRVVQADFNYSHVDYGPVDPAQVTGGVGDITAYRLSAGVVLRFGQQTPPAPVQLGCTVQPTNVFPGDPVTVTATAANLEPKKKLSYTWTASGGELTNNNATASINTAGLAPGDYTVSGHVSEGKRPGESANCTASFRIHNPAPPTITCSANPSTVMPGDPSTITAVASSLEGLTLSYSYSSTAGQISGTTPTATLVTSGAPSGVVTVTCNVVDDLGKHASADTTVTIVTPPPPPVPKVRPLCSISFERDLKRPVRVDNEGKACLDDIALTLNRDTTSKLVIVGRHSDDETPDAAAQRDLNVEQYLTDEKGIDPARISMRTSGQPGRILDSTLVPDGASFTPGDTATFDASSVKRQGQPYAKPKNITNH